jgi:DNA-binding CsgD family transcriptional regulator
MELIRSAIETFQQAAIVPDQWPRALEKLAAALRSDAATLVLDTGNECSFAFSTGVSQFVPEYRGLPFPDPRASRVRPSVAQGFLPDHAHFTPQEIAAEPYYQEFLIPRGLGCHAVAALQENLFISLKRNVRRGGHYDGVDLASLNEVLPWLRAASRTASILWGARFSGELRDLERVGREALLLDARGRVLHANVCLTLGDGLEVSDGVLQVPRAADRPRLQRFLAALLAMGASRRMPSPTTLILARPSGRRPLILDGIGCPQALRSLHSSAAALVLVTDLEQPRIPARESLIEAFRLTPREADLASELAAGASVQSAAAHLGISEGHARQRLQEIFRKTSTSRQGELIALLSRLP